jgi:hypothetical protein
MRGTTETGRAYVQRVRPIGGRQEGGYQNQRTKKTGMAEYKVKNTHKKLLKTGLCDWQRYNRKNLPLPMRKKKKHENTKPGQVDNSKREETKSSISSLCPPKDNPIFSYH